MASKIRIAACAGLVALLVALFALFAQGSYYLGRALGFDDLPPRIEIIHFSSGPLSLGDGYRLWKLRSNHSDGDAMLTRAGLVVVPNRSESGCLGLTQDQAPDWWPALELEAAMWDYHAAPYQLYAKSVSDSEYICALLDSRAKTIYVQEFAIQPFVQGDA